MVGPPDPAEFAAAQAELIDVLGIDVTFSIPATDGVYASGVAIDPESGRPHDPTATPASGGVATEVVVRVGKAVGGEGDEAEGGAIGIMPATDGILIVEAADWPAVENATRVTIHDEPYKIVRTRGRGLTATQQHLVYVEAM